MSKSEKIAGKDAPLLQPRPKTNMAACVRLAMVLLLVLAVLILYGQGRV
jgi:hypothetical protein